MGKATWFDAAPLQGNGPVTVADPRWRRWFQDIYVKVNALGQPSPADVTVTASPMTWQYIGPAQATLIIVGAGVAKVEFSRDATTWYQVGLIAGVYLVSQSDYLRVTYGAAPIMTLVQL